ncbi:hypothetical protein FRD01_10260 [Microvenator marinus]|jgi:hypothetical protein|uniref:Uncharacterized protein n=1 Tax=Microvenator marinus TaxID=2600177 RepID=A0A5B8XQ22_9DELT|nr:hypothetical protein [Microvenator marinus]QED27615.1 hypothetical protein FRD01_10260 [Microvenator marinus]
MLVGWGCDSKPKVEQAQAPATTAPKAAEAPNSEELEAMGSFEASVSAARDRHSDFSFEAGVVPGPLRVRVWKAEAECVREVPPGAVPAEWVTNMDHTLERCIKELKSKVGEKK